MEFFDQNNDEDIFCTLHVFHGDGESGEFALFDVLPINEKSM